MTQLEIIINAFKSVRRALVSLSRLPANYDFQMDNFLKALNKAIELMEREQKNFEDAEKILKGTESLPTGE